MRQDADSHVLCTSATSDYLYSAIEAAVTTNTAALILSSEPAVSDKSDNKWTERFITVSVMDFSWSLSVPWLVEICKQLKPHACSSVQNSLMLEPSKWWVSIIFGELLSGVDWMEHTYVKLGRPFHCVTFQRRNESGTMYSTLGYNGLSQWQKIVFSSPYEHSFCWNFACGRQIDAEWHLKSCRYLPSFLSY